MHLFLLPTSVRFPRLARITGHIIHLDIFRGGQRLFVRLGGVGRRSRVRVAAAAGDETAQPVQQVDLPESDAYRCDASASKATKTPRAVAIGTLDGIQQIESRTTPFACITTSPFQHLLRQDYGGIVAREARCAGGEEVECVELAGVRERALAGERLDAARRPQRV